MLKNLKKSINIKLLLKELPHLAVTNLSFGTLSIVKEVHMLISLASEEMKQKLTVEYAADLPVNKHGSGFPLSASRKTTDEHFDYV